MPRPLQSTGRPGTPVIPENWEQAPSVVVERAMRGTVTLQHAMTAQEWSPSAQQMVAAEGESYYDGPARVQALTAQNRRTVHVAEDTEVVVDYLVAVPLAVADAVEGDEVTVTDSHDPALNGLVLLVRLVEVGTERFERDLFCTLTA